ncbi:substrate-binding periplasmic protein [Alteromonas sp. H39]|uniref:substrate-binding periplasmic protein n=1 Tax=Alteromonas sp. H39 TaxID=3389876 RepID=UPI0039E0A0F1
MNFRRIVPVIIALILSGAAYSESLKSAVSPDFPKGLHFQYLKYIEKKLATPVEISEMPFARRLYSLESGDIDLMVGLQAGREGKFTYIFPAYESLTHTLYVRRENVSNIDSKEALYHAVIAFTRQGRYSDTLLSMPQAFQINVESLEQKIAMLMHQRIDGFVHFSDSANSRIQSQGLRNDIVESSYQPEQTHNFHLAIRRGLSARLQARLTRIVSEGIAAGNFADIREAYYSGNQPALNVSSK